MQNFLLFSCFFLPSRHHGRPIELTLKTCQNSHHETANIRLIRAPAANNLNRAGNEQVSQSWFPVLPVWYVSLRFPNSRCTAWTKWDVWERLKSSNNKDKTDRITPRSSRRCYHIRTYSLQSSTKKMIEKADVTKRDGKRKRKKRKRKQNTNDPERRKSNDIYTKERKWERSDKTKISCQ